MVFKEIRIKNFRTYGDNEISIPLNFKGVKLLVANNGVGKSNIIRAIEFALFGITPGKVDEIINWNTGKNTKVELFFSNNGKEYSVLRYRKHDTHKNNLYLFQGKKNLTARVNDDTQDMINDVVGMNYKAMSSTILFSDQGQSSFIDVKPAERIKIFENLLSLKEINDYSKKIKKNITDLNEKILIKEKELEAKESLIKEQKGSKDSYIESIKNKLNEFKREKNNLEKENDSLNDRLKELNEMNLQSIMDNLNSIKDDIVKNKEVEGKILIKEDEIKEEKAISADLENKKQKLVNINNVDFEEEKRLIKEKNEVEEHNNNIKEKINDLKSKKQDVSVLKETLDSLNSDIISVQVDYKKISENLEACPTCGQHINEDKSKEILSKIESQYKEKEDRKKELKEKIDQIEKDNMEFDNKIFDLKSELKDEIRVNYSYEELDSMYEEYNTLKEKLKELEYSLKDVKNHNERVNNEIKELKNQMRDIDDEFTKYDVDEIQSLIEEEGSIGEKIKNNKLKIEHINETAKNVYDKKYVKSLEDKIKAEEKSKKKIENNLISLKDDLKHLKFIENILSNKNGGFKKYIINKIISFLNTKVNFYLPFFFDQDIKIEIDKDLNEKITIDNKEVSLSVFSSGQMTRLRAAFSFSLFDVSKIFYSSNINLLVIDEFLDAKLDSYGIDAVVNIIEQKAKDNSVLVISHNEHFKDTFSSHIVLDADEHGNTILKKAA